MFLSRAWMLAVCEIVALAAAGCHAYDESLVRERGHRASSEREGRADAGESSDAGVDAANGVTDAEDGAVATGDARDVDATTAGTPASREHAGGAGGTGGAANGDNEGKAGADAAGSASDESAADGTSGNPARAGSSGGSGQPGSAGAGGAAPPNSGPACAEANARVWQTNGHCYFPLSVRNSWYVSRDRCSELAAHLVSIASSDEQSFVSSLVGSSPSWIGLARFGAPAFSWIDGQNLTYENWDKDAPTLANESAVALRPATFLWFDDKVSEPYPAICERE